MWERVNTSRSWPTFLIVMSNSSWSPRYPVRESSSGVSCTPVTHTWTEVLAEALVMPFAEVATRVNS